jgi:hypothetical protein
LDPFDDLPKRDHSLAVEEIAETAFRRRSLRSLTWVRKEKRLDFRLLTSRMVCPSPNSSVDHRAPYRYLKDRAR